MLLLKRFYTFYRNENKKLIGVTLKDEYNEGLFLIWLILKKYYFKILVLS